MTLSKDYYQEVQEAVRESGDAFMVHNPRLALRKALQAARELFASYRLGNLPVNAWAN